MTLVAQEELSRDVGRGDGIEIVEAARDSIKRSKNSELEKWISEAAKAYRGARFAVAIDWYDRAIQAAPNNAEIQSALQLAVEKRNQQREWLESLPRTAAEREQHHEAAYDAARALYKADKFAEAYEAFYKLWIVAGDYEDTLKHLERSRNKGNLKFAEVPMDDIANEAPAMPMEAAASDPNKAETLAPETIAVPENVEAAAVARDPKLRVDELILQAQFEAQRGNADISRELYNQALQIDPENKIVQYNLKKLEETAAAPSSEPSPASLESERVRQLVELSRDHQAKGEFDLAKAALREAVAIDRDNPDVVAAIQSLDLAMAKPVETAPVEPPPAASIQPEPAAVASAPAAATEPAPVDEKAELERLREEARKAEEEAGRRRAMELQQEIEGLLAQAKGAMETKNYDLAAASYQKVLELDGANRPASKGLKDIEDARNADQKKAMEAEVERAIQSANAALKANRPEEAIESFNKALSLDSSNKAAKSGIKQAEEKIRDNQRKQVAAAIEADMNVAREHMANGRYTEARATLEYILGQAPNYAPAEKELSNLASMEAAAERAEQERMAQLEAAAAKAGQAQAPPPVVTEVAPAESNTFPVEPVTASAAQPRSFEVAQAEVPPPPPAQPQAAPADEPLDVAPPPPPPAAAAQAPLAPPARAAMTTRVSAEDRATLESLFSQAMELYRAGQLEEARRLWEEMLRIDPTEKRAQTYLEQTQPELERLMADRQAQAASLEAQQSRERLLSSPVTIQTDRPTPLAEFMRLISFSTVEEIEYYIAAGADAEVYANFIDRPLREVLDAVLLPIGLTWEMDAKNLITIKTDLVPRTFNLSTDQMNKIRALLDTGTLQNIIWGQETPPARGIELTLDERERILLVVGSRTHVEKMEDFLATLDVAETPDLETRIYQIRPEDGAKIRALIGALIEADARTPFQLERKVFVDGSDLIIRDTPENIVRIEELLLDEEFIQDLRDEELTIVNFSLVPRDVENQGSDQIRFFTRRVVEAIQTLLYAATGRGDAAAQGRRMWFDETTLQLTIVDTPTNIERVGRYIESLPELAQRRQQEVVFLEHAIAEDLANQIAQILEIAAPATGGPGGTGNQTVKRLRRGEQFTFGNIRIRMTRVEEGDPNDRDDDQVELQLISGTQSNQLTITELETTFFENYEITAENVQPSGGGGGGGGGATGRQGEGTATIVVREIAPIEDAATAAPTAGEEAPEPELEEGLSISPYGSLNALIIRYDNPALYQDARELIAQLDLPTKQVEVETKFVQVNENRAKEFSSNFELLGFQNDAEFNSDFWQLNSRFAQNIDEFRNTFEPPIENPIGATLLKGTTVFDLIWGDSPAINFQLRLLEAEGIINITNGPKVTMLDGVEGDFRIDGIGPVGAAAGGGGIFGAGGAAQGVFNPFGQAGGQQEILENEDAATFQNRYSSTILLVTPEITSEKSIILDIIAELLDFDTHAGQLFSIGFLTGQAQPGTAPTSPLPPIVDPNQQLVTPVVNPITGVPELSNPGPLLAAVGNEGSLLRTRKKIQTTARIANGGTIVLGGWTGEFTQELTSGVPVLRNMPYIGKLFFSRNQRSTDRTTLLVFLTGNIIE